MDAKTRETSSVMSSHEHQTTTNVTPVRRRRSNWSFSLRTMLGLMVVISVALAIRYNFTTRHFARKREAERLAEYHLAAAHMVAFETSPNPMMGKFVQELAGDLQVDAPAHEVAFIRTSTAQILYLTMGPRPTKQESELLAQWQAGSKNEEHYVPSERTFYKALHGTSNCATCHHAAATGTALPSNQKYFLGMMRVTFAE